MNVEAAGFRGGESDLFSLSADLLDGMTADLERIVTESNVRCGLVVDRTGCVLASAGKFGSLSPYTMGATAAATIAALYSIVANTTSPEISVDFCGAGVDKIHFAVIGDRLILCLLHNPSQTGSNMRAAAKEFIDNYLPRIQQDAATMRIEDSGILESVNYIESKLDELFKDSFFDGNGQ